MAVIDTEKRNGKVSREQAQINEIRAKLRQLAGQYDTEDVLERNAPKVGLISGMSIPDGIRFLKTVYDEEQAEAIWTREMRYRPMDGAAATARVLRDTFGGISTPGGMGFWGPTPPVFIDVEVGPDEFEQVPKPGDAVVLPHMPEVEFIMGATYNEEVGELFVLHARGKKACAGEVQAIFHMVEDELRENSIYRGKAIHDGFGFLNVEGVDPDKVVYAEVTQGELETNIFARIRHTEALRAYGVANKGAVLLEGTYGTGKTLAAYLTAREAVEAGWTFILIRPEHIAGSAGTEVFRRAMQTAELYEPAVVFVEDVDTLTHSDSEADRISVMLDVFDGARSKGREVLAILTTNHVEEIHKGMVRPGRIDAVITIPPPDKAGIIKLCKVLTPDELLSDEITDEEWDHVATAMEGFIPAAVAEACARAVRYMIVRSDGEVNGSKIDYLDLARAAEGLQAQMQLLADAKDVPERESLTVAFERVIRGEAEEVTDRVVEDKLYDVLGDALGISRPKR